MLLANAPAPAANQVAVAPAVPPAPKKQPAFGDFLVPALWLAGALLVGAMIYKIVGLIRDSQRRKAARDDSVHGQLAQFRQSFERGEMSEAEYERVHKLLTGKVKQQAGVASPQPAAETPAAKPPETPSGNGQPAT